MSRHCEDIGVFSLWKVDESLRKALRIENLPINHSSQRKGFGKTRAASDRPNRVDFKAFFDCTLSTINMESGICAGQEISHRYYAVPYTRNAFFPKGTPLFAAQTSTSKRQNI